MKNQIKTILLIGILSVVLIALGGLLGKGYVYAFTAIAALLNLGAYFFSDRIVLKMHRARAIGPGEVPWLHGIVEELAARAGIPKPRLFSIPDDHANAFATGRNPENAAVAVTDGILRLLSRNELRGVLAHEIAHIRNRDTLIATIAAVLAAAVTYVAHVLSFGAMLFGGQSRDSEDEAPATGGLMLAVIAPISATLIQLGISRSREYLADETGARLCNDPESLARALERLAETAEVVPGHPVPATASLFIVNPLAGGESMTRWFSTHPALGERIRRLRRMAGRSKEVAA